MSSKSPQPKSKTLPPRHSGYRAAASGRYVTTVEGRKLPAPPSGGGGGSKGADSK